MAVLPVSHPPSITLHRALRWRSRRGILELDLLLERFWGKFGDGLSAEDAKALETLLSYEDNDLLELILGDEKSSLDVTPDCDKSRALASLIGKINGDNLD